MPSALFQETLWGQIHHKAALYLFSKGSFPFSFINLPGKLELLMTSYSPLDQLHHLLPFHFIFYFAVAFGPWGSVLKALKDQQITTCSISSWREVLETFVQPQPPDREQDGNETLSMPMGRALTLDRGCAYIHSDILYPTTVCAAPQLLFHTEKWQSWKQRQPRAAQIPSLPCDSWAAAQQHIKPRPPVTQPSA